MSVPLAVETAEGVGYEDANRVANVASEEGVGQFGRFERDDEQAGILSLSIAEGRQSADMGHPLTPQAIQNLFLRHEAHFWREDGAFRAVA